MLKWKHSSERSIAMQFDDATYTNVGWHVGILADMSILIIFV
jgi:hypothetical protein